jgi:signal transduction histidine kinase
MPVAELERRIAELDAFCYSIAHELRAPLHVISGFARALELSDAESLSPRGRERLRRVIEGAGAMDRLIDDLLAFARAERIDVQRSPVALDELVRDLLQALRPAYPRTRVVVSPLPRVDADPALVRQVFVNLIGNALKFSGLQDHPVVEIGASEAPGEAGVIFVRDNGVGFPPEEASRLFMPFERLHGDRGYPGTGVGLAIVKRLIERHGGWITATSGPGEPTEFRFRLQP